MKSFFHLLELAGQERRELSISILLAGATISSSIALAGFSAFLISMAALQPTIAEIQTAIVAVRLFGITRGVFRYLERLVSHTATFAILTRIRVWFYEQIERILPAGLEKNRRGEILNRSVTDIDALREFYLRVVNPIGLAILITMGSILYFSTKDPQVASLHLLGMASIAVVMPLISFLSSRQEMQLIAKQRGNLRSDLVENLQGLADITLFGAAIRREKLLLQASSEYSDQKLKLGKRRAFRRSTAITLMNLGTLLILVRSIQLVESGQLPGYLLASMVLIALASYEAVLPMGEITEQIDESASAADRVFHLAGRGQLDGKLIQNDIPEAITGNMKIEGLTFAYPGSTGPALIDVSLQWNRGEKIAIVGPSGAGKSSIANLLLGYWRPERGRIYLGNQDICDIPAQSLQKFFGALDQKAHVFNASMLENILISKPSSDQAEVESAAKRAGLTELINRLPQAWNSWLGEGGQKISGGERQKVALARVFLQDPQAIIFDEASAHLDWSSSQSLNELIWNSRNDKSLLVITHRLQGLEMADRIYVMDQARIVEMGKHEELLESKGKYWQMWHAEEDDLEKLWIENPL